MFEGCSPRLEHMLTSTPVGGHGPASGNFLLGCFTAGKKHLHNNYVHVFTMYTNMLQSYQRMLLILRSQSLTLLRLIEVRWCRLSSAYINCTTILTFLQLIVPWLCLCGDRSLITPLSSMVNQNRLKKPSWLSLISIVGITLRCQL